MNTEVIGLVVLVLTLFGIGLLVVSAGWDPEVRRHRQELWQRDRQLQRVTQEAMRQMLAELRNPRRDR